MKVNIRGVIYDAEKEPILVELNKSDKQNISNMAKEFTKYICFPDSMKFEEVENLLKLKQQEKKLKLDQDVYFLGENLPMKVMAISDRYAICSRKLYKKEDDDLLAFEVKRGAVNSKKQAFDKLKDSPVYTILDFYEEIRGSDNYIFSNFDYADAEECSEAIEELESGEMEISSRNRVELNIDWERTEKLN